MIGVSLTLAHLFLYTPIYLIVSLRQPHHRAVCPFLLRTGHVPKGGVLTKIGFVANSETPNGVRIVWDIPVGKSIEFSDS